MRPLLLAAALLCTAPLIAGCPKTYAPDKQEVVPNPPGEKGEVTSGDSSTGTTDTSKETPGRETGGN